MALKDLIATPGEAAAARIIKKYRFTGEAQEQLRMQIQHAVDSACATERERAAQLAERSGFLEHEDGATQISWKDAQVRSRRLCSLIADAIRHRD